MRKQWKKYTHIGKGYINNTKSVDWKNEEHEEEMSHEVEEINREEEK